MPPAALPRAEGGSTGSGKPTLTLEVRYTRWFGPTCYELGCFSGNRKSVTGQPVAGPGEVLAFGHAGFDIDAVVAWFGGIREYVRT